MPSPRKQDKKKGRAETTESKEKSTTSRHIEFVAHSDGWVEDDDDVAAVARSSTMEALQNAIEETIEGRGLAYGNQNGLNLLETTQTVAKFQTQIQQLEEMFQTHEKQLEDHQRQIKVLQAASAGYLEIRHRFIDVYRRDVAGHLTTQTRPSIQRGNIRAHHGDCVTDAELYSRQQRTDEQIYVRLYGLTWKTVQTLSKYENRSAIELLDQHGTAEADASSPMPDLIKQAFTAFCNELADQPSRSPNLYTGDTFSKAYLAYFYPFDAWNRDRKNAQARAIRERRPETTG